MFMSWTGDGNAHAVFEFQNLINIKLVIDIIVEAWSDIT